ncbi:MAG: hypothetical protein KC561_20865, partial [Myxococcales bacterium]|nr:hypothetical protein [Myxococcales bacterium]
MDELSRKIRVIFFASVLALSFGLAGCSDDDPDTTPGGTDTTQQDTTGGNDTTTGSDATTSVTNACVNDTDTPLLDDAQLAGSISPAVQYCALNSCAVCISNPSSPACACPDGVEEENCLAACVVDCIQTYEDGTASDEAVDTVVQTARDAGFTEECLGCSAGVTGCLAGAGCAAACSNDPTSCDCLTCACGDNSASTNCPAEYATCSGRDPYVDCAAIAVACGGEEDMGMEGDT